MTDPVLDKRKLAFGYWTDPLCIWAYVAQARLDALLADFGTQLHVDHHVVPVFGSLPWRFSEGPWAESGIDGRVAATRRVAQDHGYENVTGEVWRDATPASSWSPGAAIKAVFNVERDGDIADGRAAQYQWELRKNFFVENKNIACRSVQLEIAESMNIPRTALEGYLDDGSALAALWEDENNKKLLHIQGSPTYVFDGGRAKLYGNFDEGVLQATVRELIKGLAPGGSDC